MARRDEGGPQASGLNGTTSDLAAATLTQAAFHPSSVKDSRWQSDRVSTDH